MKKLNLYLFPFIAAIIILSSCGKDGAVGPVGPTGATGQTGAVGPAGPAGANGTSGSVIYSGTTSPPATTGATGDFYINLSTGLLYGPKTTNGWGTGFSLIGPAGAAGAPGAAGAAGAAGSKIYSGSGAPASTIGTTGDYYLDKTNFLLYGAKTSSGWGTPIALQGPAGPQGPMGNANVKTDTFTVAANKWLLSVPGGGYPFETATDGTYNSSQYLDYARANNSVTQDVLDNGMVLVYIEPMPDFGPEIWDPVPFQYPISNSSNVYQYDINFVTLALPGTVIVGFYFAQPGAGVILPNITTYRPVVNYRFKIITVTGQAGVFMVQNHVNIKNYVEVSKALGLWQQDKRTH